MMQRHREKHEAPLLKADMNADACALSLLKYAILYQASDVHIEPQEQHFNIRIREDGLLTSIATLTQQQGLQLCAHFKVLASMNVAESRRPQDGAISWRQQDMKVNIRLSTLKNIYGEKLVLRLHHHGAIQMNLADLNLSQRHLQYLQHALSQPQGFILITGPTGSGKTHTLYTALSYLNQEHTHIATLEDPVEISLQGLHQVSINPHINMGYAEALRALLRQDPDVIMLGEIRDTEVADIAVKASQTGHLVLSSMHTNSSFESFYRLQSLGIEPDRLVHTLKLVISQRLVRILCQHCKSADIRSDAKLAMLGQHPSKLSSLTFFKPEGCTLCHQGYRGRVPIFDMLPIDSDLKQQIYKMARGDMPGSMLNEYAGLIQSGMRLAKKGITSLDEIIKAIHRDIDDACI